MRDRAGELTIMEAYLLLLTFSFFISSFPLSHSQTDNEYRECQPSPCGKVGYITYPFWSEEIGRPRYCGRDGFWLKCPQHGDHYPFIQIGSQTFNVTHIDPFSTHTNTMTLVRTEFVYDNCSSHFTNTSLSVPPNLFHYDKLSVKNVTLFYGCATAYSNWGMKFPCQRGTSPNSNSNIYAFYTEDFVIHQRLPDLIENCEQHILVPVSAETDSYTQDNPQALQLALGKGFRVRYDVDESCGKCLDSHGICGSNYTSPFTCYCSDGHQSLYCSDSSHSSGMRLFISSSHFLSSQEFSIITFQIYS